MDLDEEDLEKQENNVFIEGPLRKKHITIYGIKLLPLLIVLIAILLLINLFLHLE